MKTLSKSTTDKQVCGVCGGLAQYLGIDSSIVRIITVVAALFSGGIVGVVYVACAIILPEDINVSSNDSASTKPDYIATPPAEDVSDETDQ